MKTSRNILIAVIVVALVVIGLSWWLSRSAGPNVDNSAAVNRFPGDGVSTSPSSASLAVDDQVPGTTVFVSEVNLPTGGWVLIHKDAGGRTGTMIGAGYFGSNVHAGEVILSEPTVDGSAYYATLAADNGDERFDPRTDTALVDQAGNAIGVHFKTIGVLPNDKG